MIDRLRAYLRAILDRAKGPPSSVEDDALPWGGFGLSSPLYEGPRVRDLQAALGVDVTGVYDEVTAAAVVEEKRRRGIAPDERADPAFLRELGLEDRPPA